MQNLFELYEGQRGYVPATQAGLKIAEECANALKERHGGPISSEEAKRRYFDDFDEPEDSSDRVIVEFAKKAEKWARKWIDVGAGDSESRWALRRYTLKLLTKS